MKGEKQKNRPRIRTGNLQNAKSHIIDKYMMLYFTNNWKTYSVNNERSFHTSWNGQTN